MRIAVYYNLPSGGAKRALYEMVKRLSQAHIIDVFTLSTADHDFCDLRPYVQNYVIYPFEPARLFVSPFGRLNQWQRAQDIGRLDAMGRLVAAEIDAIGYDVVFAHICMFTQAPPLLPYLKTPSVYYCQESLRLLHEPPISRPYLNESGLRGHIDRLDPFIRIYHTRLREVDRSATLAAGFVLVNSYFSQSNINRIYGLSSHVAYLGVDTEIFSPSRHTERENYVLSVGALRPNKGFDFIIDAMSLLPVNDRPILYIVANAGNEAEQAFLEARASAAGVKLHIELAVPLDVLLDRYRRARFIVYAPVHEPFGFVPLEAMACCTPVVAVADGGVLETVRDGETGLLVSRDPAQFAIAMTELLSSPTTIEAYGRIGRRIGEQEWTWDAAVERIEGYLAAAGSQVDSTLSENVSNGV